MADKFLDSIWFEPKYKELEKGLIANQQKPMLQEVDHQLEDLDDSDVDEGDAVFGAV